MYYDLWLEDDTDGNKGQAFGKNMKIQKKCD